MDAGTAAGRIRCGLFSLGVLPTSGSCRDRLGQVGLVAATGFGRVSGNHGLGSGRCTLFAMGRVRLIAGWRELVPKELALSWRKLALRGARVWCTAARHRLGLISFDWGTTRATAPIGEGLISLGAARGIAGGLFRFNLRWPSALVLLGKRAWRWRVRGSRLRWHGHRPGRLGRRTRIAPAARAQVLPSFKRFGGLTSAPAFSGLTSLVLDGNVRWGARTAARSTEGGRHGPRHWR